MTVKEALVWAQEQLQLSSDSALLDAELLLLHALQQDNRTWLVAHADDEILKDDYETFSKLIGKRTSGIPIAYITHYKSFYGRDFYVDERVLVPRPETEQLVEEALKKIHESNSPTVIDVGTGSGIIPITILKELNSKIICYATDISQDALDVAQQNAEAFEVADKITFLQGNLLEPILSVVDTSSPLIITANLPYVPKHEYEENKHNLQHEPYQALVAEDDGMALIEELFNQLLENKLKATVILEHGHQHKEDINKVITRYSPTSQCVTLQDISGSDRITIVSLM